jgi:hypothetical protein
MKELTKEELDFEDDVIQGADVFLNDYINEATDNYKLNKAYILQAIQSNQGGFSVIAGAYKKSFEELDSLYNFFKYHKSKSFKLMTSENLHEFTTKLDDGFALIDEVFLHYEAFKEIITPPAVDELVITPLSMLEKRMSELNSTLEKSTVVSVQYVLH